jgi:hypothetical protein
MGGTDDYWYNEKKSNRNKNKKDQKKSLKKDNKSKLKASDLTKNEAIFKRIRKRQYATEYEKCLDLIQTVNDHCHLQYTTYAVPVMIPGQPHFDADECTIYLKEELLKAEFYVRLMKPGNVLYISWKLEDIEKVRKSNEKKLRENYQDDTVSDVNEDSKHRQEKSLKSSTPMIIDYNPESALSNVRLTTSLMLDNPKYAHLKSVKKLKHNRNKRS